MVHPWHGTLYAEMKTVECGKQKRYSPMFVIDQLVLDLRDDAVHVPLLGFATLTFAPSAKSCSLRSASAANCGNLAHHPWPGNTLLFSLILAVIRLHLLASTNNELHRIAWLYVHIENHHSR
ncbi:hypothetical protein D3C73_1109820 [compost metagenome]